MELFFFQDYESYHGASNEESSKAMFNLLHQKIIKDGISFFSMEHYYFQLVLKTPNFKNRIRDYDNLYEVYEGRKSGKGRKLGFQFLEFDYLVSNNESSILDNGDGKGRSIKILMNLVNSGYLFFSHDSKNRATTDKHRRIITLQTIEGNL